MRNEMFISVILLQYSNVFIEWNNSIIDSHDEKGDDTIILLDDGFSH